MFKDWECFNTGGNCMVMYKDLPLKNNDTKLVAINNECIIVFDVDYEAYFNSNEEFDTCEIEKFVWQGKLTCNSGVDKVFEQETINELSNAQEYYLAHYI